MLPTRGGQGHNMCRGAGLGGSLGAAALTLLIACGEEVPRTPPEETPQEFAGHACELVSSSELSQLFVSRLEPVREDRPGNPACTWKAAEADEAAFRYEVHPYVADLQAGVRAFAPDDGADLQVEVRQGLGEAAVWTDIGLFVSRNGHTVLLIPFDDESPRAIYEELASLLLERLETSR